MTKRTVVWDKLAENELASIWLGSGQSQSVTQASYAIDRDLTKDAERYGSPLVEGLMVIERPPLRAVFVIEPDDMLVRVLSLAIVRMKN